ncbi:hypothetical protein SteCoe_7486 [Stentor coeruleus]|uniref:Uncharacterized protein n=1 Tax=Stentor coeruleus TaxID=5963 RepID=A0A1R2CMF0_9CILI|nr:hypothetical protein SteCoe_7486 [Stentor coeruleus]
MALSAFNDQIQKYKDEAFSDFRRMNLAYAFQDLVNDLKTPKDVTKELLEGISALLSLQEEDSQLMKTIGYDLLESSIKLYVLSGTTPNKPIKDLSIAIAYSSNAKEILIQLNSIMAYSKIEGEENPLDFFKDITIEGRNITKAIVTFYLSVIIQKIEEKHLKIAMQELYIYIEFLEQYIDEAYEVLGSDLMTELFKAITNRSFQLKINSHNQTLKFLIKLAIIYHKLDKYKNFKEENLLLIWKMFGDLSQILSYFKATEDFNSLSFGFLILAGEVCDDSSQFKLPYSLSRTYRLQILLLNTVQVGNEDPDLFIKIFAHCIENLNDNVSLKSISNPFANTSFKDLLTSLLDFCGGPLPNEIKKQCWFYFQLLLEKIDESEKFSELICFLKSYQWDMAKGMLLDWFCKQAIKGKLSPIQSLQVLNSIIPPPKAEESLETLQAAINLHRIVWAKSQNTDFLDLQSQLKEKYIQLKESLMQAQAKTSEVGKIPLVLNLLEELLSKES